MIFEIISNEVVLGRIKITAFVLEGELKILDFKSDITGTQQLYSINGRLSFQYPPESQIYGTVKSTGVSCIHQGELV
jgi:hypothetical protein